MSVEDDPEKEMVPAIEVGTACKLPVRAVSSTVPTARAKVDFIDGLRTVCGSGSAESRSGVAIHLNHFTVGMAGRALCNADGDMLVVAQAGALEVRTELGRMRVASGKICVVQRGVHRDPIKASTNAAHMPSRTAQLAANTANRWVTRLVVR